MFYLIVPSGELYNGALALFLLQNGENPYAKWLKDYRHLCKLNSMKIRTTFPGDRNHQPKTTSLLKRA
jgi:hypothetical protein